MPSAGLESYQRLYSASALYRMGHTLAKTEFAAFLFELLTSLNLSINYL
jgi:hypothetical protein